MNTPSDKMIEIIEFTDPVCTWCWGSEPVLRKLETRFGEQVKISYIKNLKGRILYFGSSDFCVGR